MLGALGLLFAPKPKKIWQVGIALRDPGLELVPGPQYFNMSELNRYLKEVYAERLEELRNGGPDSLLRMIPFEQTDYLGKAYHVPVVLSVNKDGTEDWCYEDED